MHVCVKMSDPLAPELQTVVNCYDDLNLDPLKEVSTLNH